MRKEYALFLFIPLLLVMCHPAQRVTKSNLAYIYYNDPTIIHPSYKVYHEDDQLSVMYIRVKSSEILYSKNNPEKKFLGKMYLQVRVYDLNDNRNEISSDTVFLFDRSGPADDKYLLGKLDMDLPYGKKYMAEITFDDEYRMQFVQDVLFIDKSNEYSEENYLITNEKGEVQFGNSFDPGQKLSVTTSRQLPKKLPLITYDPYDRLPAPPFILLENYSLDLTGEGEIDLETTDSHHFEIELGEAGIYHIPNAMEGGPGLTFLVFHSYYPYVKTVASMVRPMRFITTKQEYENLVKSNNLKKDVDEFWFKTAGNSERASEIIKEYYGRVETANKHFTSHTQGWASDRGLIFIIYGPPTSVTKTGDYETWIYTEKTNVLSVEFTFHRMDNKFTTNNYVLDRSGSYKSSWYRFIDSWRQGRIYK